MTGPGAPADVIVDHLSVTKGSIYTWSAKRDMPAHRARRLWKFKVTGVDDLVHSYRADETVKPPTKGAR